VEWVEIADGPRPPVRAVLFLPKGADAEHRVPAVVWIEDQVNRVGDGPREVLMPGYKYVPTEDGEYAGIALARRGFAALALHPIFDPPWNEVSRPTGPTDSWGETLRQDRIAVDALMACPEIDPKRVAVAGVGLGGTRAWWLMAFDERIHCGEAIGGLTRLSDWQVEQGPNARPLAPWAETLLKQFDTEAILALCAPRPLQMLVGDRDPLTPGTSYKVFHDTAGKVYKLYDKGGNIQSTQYGRLGPELTLLEWDSMLENFDKHLMPQGPTPLGHSPEPEPAEDDRFIDPAAHGIAGWVSEMSQRPGTWTWQDGTIVCKPGPNEYGWLRCPVELDDFILKLEWKVPARGNSGVFLRARPVDWVIPPSKDGKEYVSTLGLTWPSRTGLELQAQDDPGQANKYSSGSLYRHAAPAENPTNPPGEWNRYTVRARGMRVEVWSNGKQVLDTRLDQHPTLRKPPLKGFFGLQNHGVAAEFRNIRYLRLETGEDSSRRSE
jgi:hypothetical protein